MGNAKKYIEKKNLISDIIKGHPIYYSKGSKPNKSVIICDTVGDRLKDTSGPSLNILIKLSAITSLVFRWFFEKNYFFKI